MCFSDIKVCINTLWDLVGGLTTNNVAAHKNSKKEEPLQHIIKKILRQGINSVLLTSEVLELCTIGLILALKGRRVQIWWVLMGWTHARPLCIALSFLVKDIERRNILFSEHVAAYLLTLPKHANAWGEMDDSNFHSLSCHFIMRKQIGSIQCTCYCRVCSSCSIRLQLKPIKSPLWLLISRDSICIRFRVCNSLVAAFKATYSRQETSCWLLPC